MEKGRWITPIQNERARMITGATLRYDIGNGFPLLTERDLTAPIKSRNWPSILDQAVAEIAAFLNGARSADEYEAWGCFWWRERWLNEKKCADFNLAPGDNGPGSYGAVLTNLPTHDGEPYFGKPYNQVEAIQQSMRGFPAMRTHVLTTWFPPYVYAGENRRVVVAPCHGTVFQFQIDIERKELRTVHIQRSADLLVGVVANIIQWNLVGLAWAKIAGLTYVEHVHFFHDPHIYEGQLPKLEQLLSREPQPFPTVTLDDAISDLRDIRPAMVKVEDYNPHPSMFIPTPV